MCNVSVASLKHDEVSQKPIRAHGNPCKWTEQVKKKKKKKAGFPIYTVHPLGRSWNMDSGIHGIHEAGTGFKPTLEERGNEMGGSTAPTSLGK